MRNGEGGKIDVPFYLWLIHKALASPEKSHSVIFSIRKECARSLFMQNERTLAVACGNGVHNDYARCVDSLSVEVAHVFEYFTVGVSRFDQAELKSSG